jgi:ketopantoate hydroxymethyltransferase
MTTTTWPEHRRITIRDLADAKARGERWPMRTAYDQNAAEIFDEAGIPVLLIGDSAGNNVFGGSRVEGGGVAGEVLLADAKALEAAGAFGIVLEVVPAESPTSSTGIPASSKISAEYWS